MTMTNNQFFDMIQSLTASQSAVLKLYDTDCSDQETTAEHIQEVQTCLKAAFTTWKKLLKDL